MNREQTLFLSLLRDHYAGTAGTEIPEDTDFDALAKLAEEQCLSGVIYAQLKALGDAPHEALEKLQNGFFSDVFYAVNRQKAMEEVLARSGGMPCVPFKGWLVKDSWPVPELRTMGDTDLLIREKDRPAWDRLMQELGYQKYVDNHAVWLYSRQEMIFELHIHMFYEELTGLADYRGFFDRAWEYAGPPLDPTFHLLYLLCHLAKHVVNKGMGWRGFLDLAFFCRANASALDLPRLEQGLSELHLAEFAGICSALCLKWFGAELPIAPGTPGESFAADVTEKLFRDGTFGLDNTENESGIAARDIKRREGSYSAGALALILRRLFPPYRDMQLVPWYSFVDGRPWLMPAAWVYRWIYCLFHKVRHSAAMLSEPFVKKTQIDARTEQIRKWGL